MQEECLICKEKFDEEAFVKHLRNHKIKVEDYYIKYRPKVDLLSGEQIRFKNREFYLSSLFNTRTNMVKYLKAQDSDFKREIIIKKIIELRQSVKNFEVAPSTIEARTQILPTPLLVQEFNLDYNKLWKEVGAKPRYDYSANLKFNRGKTLRICIDTREQKPLSFDCDSIVGTLKYGDYSAIPSTGIAIERKSLVDLCGTLSAGYERFQREIERCHASNENLIVCVETDPNALQSYNYLPHMRKIKATPEFICHRMRELCQKYPQVQFLLLKNRTEMSRVIPRLLITKSIINLDLQYIYDKKMF